jgi:hypothetical protein
MNLFCIMARPALMPFQPLVQWVMGELSIEVKDQEHKDGHIPCLAQGVKMSGAIHRAIHPIPIRLQCTHRGTSSFSLSVSRVRSFSELDSLKIIIYNSQRQLAVSHFYSQFLGVSGREGIPFEVIFYMLLSEAPAFPHCTAAYFSYKILLLILYKHLQNVIGVNTKCMQGSVSNVNEHKST